MFVHIYFIIIYNNKLPICLFVFSKTFLMNNKEKSIFTPTFDTFWLRDTNNDTVDVIKHGKVRFNIMLFYYKCFSNMIL